MDNDRTLINQRDLYKAFLSFYIALLESNSTEQVSADWDKLYPKGSIDLHHLEAEFNEVRNAVFSLAKNKALKTNGFWISF